MNILWPKLLSRLTVLLAAEICFSLLGIDDLADYSEFIFEKNGVVRTKLLAKNSSK